MDRQVQAVRDWLFAIETCVACAPTWNYFAAEGWSLDIDHTQYKNALIHWQSENYKSTPSGAHNQKRSTRFVCLDLSKEWRDTEMFYAA